MTTQPRLVNKQFNSPIGLYSEQNVREVLQREQQILANGAIGIDFHNPAVGKPANLQNSAVLRMLEEEENRRGGRAGYGDYDSRPLRDLSWPPLDYDQQNLQRSSFKDVVTPGAKRVAWPPPQEGILDPAEVVQYNAVQAQVGPRYSNQTPGLQQNNYSSQQAAPYQQPAAPYQQPAAPYQQPAQQSYRPLKPLDVSSVGTGSPLASPALNQSPQGYRSITPSGSRAWAPVQSPVTTPQGPGAQKYFGAPAQGYQSQPQYQPVAQPYQQANQGYQSGPGQYQQGPYQQFSQSRSISPQPFQPGPQQYQSQSFGQSAPSQQSFGQFAPSQQQHQPPSFSQSAPSQQSVLGQQQFQPQSFGQPAPSQQQYQSQPFGQSAPSQNQAPSQSAVAQTQVAAPRQPVKQVEPPPSTITLRPAAPVSQAPPPVYSAQPATASLKVVVGGKNLRGDLKWPPDVVRDRMEEENRARIELSRGPAFRPLRKDKDYTPFFARHALNSTYPGYKIPPGTQFYRPE